MREIRLRDARFDEPAVEDLLAQWNEELGFAPKGGSAVETGECIAPNGVFVLALAGERAAGRRGAALMPSVGEFKRLFVRPDARRRENGRALLAGLEEHAVRLGFEELRLDTDGGEPAALALFRGAGFRAIGDYNGNPYARYWFARRLPAPPGLE
jgi:ribosomal protein S18 acetylase RimI-like enzyme